MYSCEMHVHTAVQTAALIRLSLWSFGDLSLSRVRWIPSMHALGAMPLGRLAR